MIPTEHRPLDAETFSGTWQHYFQRWTARNERFARIDRVVRGDWLTVDLDDREQDNRSPNLIQVALEDTAEAASLVPSVRVTPSRTEPDAKEKAQMMERIGTAYLDASEIQLLTIKSLQDLVGLGMFSWVVTFDPELGPRIEWRDPRTCYPEPDVSSLGVTNRAFFARDMYLTQLHEPWQEIFHEHIVAQQLSPRYFTDHTLTLVEYYDRDEFIVAVQYESNKVPAVGMPNGNRSAGRVTVILERMPNPIGICPVVVGKRVVFDNEPRGQFDQVISMLEAHIRLMALTLDYADQAVYSDVWVSGLIGQMPIGGGSYIQLDVNGKVGRVPPAVTSFTVFEELKMLIENMHVASRWPKTRPGDIDQAIASGKFVESTVGMMNTVIRTLHLIMRRALEQALRVAFEWDGRHGRKRSSSGVLRNQMFMIEHQRSDIDTTARVRAEYGMGLGHTPSESMVMGIQASQAGLVSQEFVQENFEGINDVLLEQIRIDQQQIRDMMFAELLEGTKMGTVPKSALPKIHAARGNGDSIAELFEKYVAGPEEEMMNQMLTLGSGEQVMPGPAPVGPAPPPPPDAAGELAALFGEPDEELQTINRTSVPTGPGSFSGVQTGG